jgi:hypothetical protein
MTWLDCRAGLDAVGPVLATVTDTATDPVGDVLETASAVPHFATSSTHAATLNEEPTETESAVVVELLTDALSDSLMAADADGRVREELAGGVQYCKR